jgi:hypothetical protein
VLFAVVGIHGLVFWVVVHPSTQSTYAQRQWPNVLWFSALLLSLGIAVLVFGRMVGGRAVVRWATIAAAVVSLAGLVNIVEDGLRVEGAFLLFVLCTLTFNIALITLTVGIARSAPDRYRLFALVPAGTLAGILFFVAAGGPIFLVTWLAAAAAAAAASPPARVVPTA